MRTIAALTWLSDTLLTVAWILVLVCTLGGGRQFHAERDKEIQRGDITIKEALDKERKSADTGAKCAAAALACAAMRSFMRQEIERLTRELKIREFRISEGREQSPLPDSHLQAGVCFAMWVAITALAVAFAIFIDLPSVSGAE